jgi:hypothetical protein
MENTNYKNEKNLKDFLKQNHFETLTYDKLLEIKEDITEEPQQDIPFETVDKIDNLIEEKRRKIKALNELDKLGYSFSENVSHIELLRSKTSKRSDIMAIILGSLLSLFTYIGFFIMFTYIFGTAPEDFTFSTFITLSFIFLIGFSGLALMAKGLMRRANFKKFKISTDSSNIILNKNKSSEMYSKQEYLFENEHNGSKHKIYLKSKLNSNEIKDIFVFEFSNKAYFETVDYLIYKLNS